MNKKYIVIILGILLVTVLGWKYQSLGGGNMQMSGMKMSDTSTSTSMSMDHSMSAMNMSGTSVLAGSRVVMDNINNLTSGNVTFSFKLYDIDGKELTDQGLAVAHEKKMHFIFVRDDMTGYQHIHPEYIDGKWKVSADIKEAGDYNLYIDIAPIKENPVVLHLPFRIDSATKVKNFPVANIGMSISSGVYTATLTTDKPLTTNQEIKLSIAITKSGIPFSHIMPYLGALSHLVILNHDNPEDYVHAHPLTETTPADGVIQFHTTFQTKGTYTLFGQFNLDGKVITLPITVNVLKDGTAATSGGDSMMMQMDNGSMMHK